MHGPFTMRREKLQMRSHLDFTATCEEIFYEAIRFESRNSYCQFDQVFGKYCRYGHCSLTKPSFGETLSMEEDHKIATLGEGTLTCPISYQRRNVVSLGIDFKFNFNRESLSISVRYMTKTVREDDQLLAILRDRERVTGDQYRSRRRQNRNIQMECSSVIKEGVDFLYLDASYHVNTYFCETMFADGVHCTVTESENNDSPVGSNLVFQVEEVK